MEKIRINKYLADKHSLSRRYIDRLIESGKIFVNGKRAILGDKVDDNDKVEIREGLKKNFLYFAYYKPRGLITVRQHKGENDVASTVGIKGIFPVGRLDKDSEGLLILTDNGRITDRLLNPIYDHEKEYLVKTRRPVKAHELKVMERGMELEGDLITKPAKTKFINDKTFTITLSEGKKHQIRRMCDAFGLPIDSLKRIRFMNILLGNLKPGQYRKIQGEELKELLSY